MKNPYDLDDRLLGLATDVCRAAEALPHTVVGKHVGGQMIRSGTSPSANYAEARGSESSRDFIHKLKLCLKELREVAVWVRLAARLELLPTSQADYLAKEVDQLLAIMFTSIRTAKRNAKSR